MIIVDVTHGEIKLYAKLAEEYLLVDDSSVDIRFPCKIQEASPRIKAIIAIEILKRNGESCGFKYMWPNTEIPNSIDVQPSQELLYLFQNESVNFSCAAENDKLIMRLTWCWAYNVEMCMKLILSGADEKEVTYCAATMMAALENATDRQK